MRVEKQTGNKGEKKSPGGFEAGTLVALNFTEHNNLQKDTQTVYMQVKLFL